MNKLSYGVGFVALALLLPASVVACGSDGKDGKDGVTDPSLSAVTPARGFLGRKVTLTISGFGTKWTKEAKPTVDFGDPEITVDPNDVTVASPTALIVVAKIGVGAKAEKKTIKVNGQSFEGFSVESPIANKIQGSLAQGGIVSITARNRDQDNPFDTTSTGDGFFTPLEYTNFTAEAVLGGKAASGVTVSINGVSDYAADMDLSLKSGPEGGEILESRAPGELKIAARMPTALSGPASGKVEKALGTDIYSFQTGAGDTLTTLNLSATAPADASPRVFILPDSGKFADLIGGRRVIGNGPQTYYGVFWDSSGTTGYNYRLEARSQNAVAVTDSAANTSVATAAVAASLPFIFKSAELSNASDEDWIQFTATGGKRVSIGTLGAAGTDTAIELFQADGTTLIGERLDNGFHETLTTQSALAAGTYLVKISAGDTYSASSKGYQAYIVEE
jgi:hypothetical protein